MYTVKMLNVVCRCHQAQLQDAKRGWEELQNYLHNVNAEREKLHAAKEGDHRVSKTDL